MDDPTVPEKAEHPLAPLARIKQRVKAAMGERGLSVHALAVVPSTNEDGPHQAQIVLMLDEDKPNVVLVKDGDDADFQAIVEGNAKAANEERARAAREDLEALREQLKDPNKGFLD